MSKPDHLKIALCQMSIVPDKVKNVDHAFDCIRRCVKEQSVRVVVLPETFNVPYDTKYFADYAESVPDGYTCQRLATLAKELEIYIIAGSIVEKDNQNKYYNTSTVWSPEGKLIGKHRKLHLYDIYVKECPFKESDVFTPGDQFTIVDIDNHKFGIGICNDFRFEELARIYRNEGVEVIIYPVEIHILQGPLFYDVLMRARAADNQVYVVAVSSARDENASYVAYGHSLVVDPYAQVCCEASEKEECLVFDLDFTKVQKIREDIPLFKQRRTDLYDTIKKE